MGNPKFMKVTLYRNKPAYTFKTITKKEYEGNSNEVDAISAKILTLRSLTKEAKPVWNEVMSCLKRYENKLGIRMHILTNTVLLMFELGAAPLPLFAYKEGGEL